MIFRTAFALLSAAAAAFAAELQPITMIAMNDPELASLVASVITVPGAAEQIAGNGPYTIFAPNNAAFAALTEIPAGDAMTKTLLTHVINGKFMSKDMTDGQVITPISGVPLTVSIKDGKVSVNGANVVTADLEGSNGVIHIIDAIMPPTVPAGPGKVEAPPAAAAPAPAPAAPAPASNSTNITESQNQTVAVNSALDLTGNTLIDFFNRSAFVGAVEKVNMTEAVAKGKLTLFVPSNGALTKAMAAAGNVTADEVSALLMYHAVNGTHIPTANSTLTTMANGQNLTISSNGMGGYKVNNVSIQATLLLPNGNVVNLIDSVLMPAA